jgi:hypothetical protein
MIGMQTANKTIGIPIAIRVDDRADTRARRALRVASGPRRRRLLRSFIQVLARCDVTILKARQLTRRYLFDVKTLALLLPELRRSRASGWLVPETPVEVKMHRHGPGCLYDAITRSLLLGRVGEPLASLDRVLTHVAYDGQRPVAAGPERAQHLAQRHRPRAR